MNTGHCESRVAGSTWSDELHQIGSGAGNRRNMGPSQTDEAGPLTGAQNEVRKHFKLSSTVPAHLGAPTHLHFKTFNQGIKWRVVLICGSHFSSSPIPFPEARGFLGALP